MTLQSDDTAHRSNAYHVVKDPEAAKDASVRSNASGKSTASSYKETGKLEDYVPPHVGQGGWVYAAYHLATTIATPAAYAPLPSTFAALGWPAGICSLVLAAVVTYYNSILLASIHQWNGKRYIRYRDLGNSICGTWGYWGVVFFQQVASVGNNISIQIVAGISMKGIYKTYNDADDFTLQEAIIVFGVAELLLSQLPDIHSLRMVNGICTFATVAFSSIAVGLSVYNGHETDRSTIDYGVHGSDVVKFSNIGFALGSIAFSFGDTVLPEIQATVRDPPERTMYKGITLAYSILSSSYLAVAVAGYWAFGSTVTPYLVDSFFKPTWVITMINVFAIIQIVGCYQIYCRPTYEYVEVKLMNHDKSPMAPRNCLVRAFITTIYIVIVTTIAAAIPFFGDFVALIGAVGFTPMDFILPVIFYTIVRRPPTWWQALNYILVGYFTIISIWGAGAAIRSIHLHVNQYEFFANL